MHQFQIFRNSHFYLKCFLKTERFKTYCQRSIRSKSYKLSGKTKFSMASCCLIIPYLCMCQPLLRLQWWPGRVRTLRKGFSTACRRRAWAGRRRGSSKWRGTSSGNALPGIRHDRLLDLVVVAGGTIYHVSFKIRQTGEIRKMKYVCSVKVEEITQSWLLIEWDTSHTIGNTKCGTVAKNQSKLLWQGTTLKAFDWRCPLEVGNGWHRFKLFYFLLKNLRNRSNSNKKLIQKFHSHFKQDTKPRLVNVK